MILLDTLNDNFIVGIIVGITGFVVSVLLAVCIGLIKHIWKERKEMYEDNKNVQLEFNKVMQGEVRLVQKAVSKSEFSLHKICSDIGSIFKWLKTSNKRIGKLESDVKQLKKNK